MPLATAPRALPRLRRPTRRPGRRSRAPWVWGAVAAVALLGALGGSPQTQPAAPVPAAASADPAPPVAAGAAAAPAAPAEPCDPVEEWDCIPEPLPRDPAPAPQEPDDGEEAEEPDTPDGPGGMAGWVFDGITSAINAFFTELATAALNPLLELLGETLLTTPTPDELPQVDRLWSNSWYIALSAYTVLVMAGGVIVMSYQTLQTQYSVREVAPRLAVGFLASALSLYFATRMIVIANALSGAVMGQGIDPDAPSVALTDMVLSSLGDAGMFTVLLGLAVAGFLVAVLVTYVIRVALITILLAGAPLALMCHALPQTEAIARWWWKAFAGLLGIQVAQSLTLVAALNVFLSSDGFTFIGSNPTGLANMLVALALFYILFKIPFWILSATRLSSGGGSIAGRLVRAYLTYKTFGLLRGAGRGGAPPRLAPGRRGPGPGPGPGRGGRRGGPSPGPAAAARRRGPRAGGPNMPARLPGPPRRPPGRPLFRAPHQQFTPPPYRATRAPAMAHFQAPNAPGQGGPARPGARPAAPPGQPVFRAPGQGRPAPRPGPRPAAPGRPRFQQPTNQPAQPPRKATRPPAAATFRSPAPQAGNVPAPHRRQPPPRPAFSSAPPPPPRPGRPSGNR
ncbi:hypothetical protein RM780_09610 [Streptomyces sp. DSM 44917]|uniref:Uncharacterized protein n=1 Tax=Streptomyces boetiae TaxID=3075541 RepID=A0ABU2L6N1_9ACTN|nr:hypothetical protein [Streptomyces sp. DSM 44917]MDT0307218.1 hypothetical protein [Streptomyces sp. DSM 44917]